ncbi:MAG: hypothetical protein KBG15_17000 [Kofleriaceae bacterium]|nr:hypothetical protein [Kofleriaceae bacterium]
MDFAQVRGRLARSLTPSWARIANTASLWALVICSLVGLAGIAVGGASIAACSDSSPASADARIIDAAVDAARIVVDDGTPMRRACSNTFGTTISNGFGRLDGFLVAIVDPGARNCNGDNDHIHLQILANNKIFDVAVNVAGSADVMTATRDLPLTGTPWQEGWHTGFALDYTALGLRSSDFTASSQAALVATIKAELASVNHISVYALGYTDGTGVHLIHRNGFNNDGVIVTQPLSRPAKWRMFRFSDQTF